MHRQSDKMDEISVIQTMVDTNSFDKNRLESILESFKDDIAVIPLLLLKDQKILRTRINADDLFYSVSDLSYPPSNCVNRTDRASLKGHPMFYGSVFTKDGEKTGCFPRVVSALETLDILKARHTTQHATFTQSVWLVNEPIHTFAFPVSDKYKRACSEINMFRNGWETYCKDRYSKESIRVFSYIGDLMATPNKSCIYDITATCVCFIINNLGFEGVVYPSVPTEGGGLNICLSPGTVDKKVDFGGAVSEVVFRRDMKSEIIPFAESKPVNSSTFVWVVTDEGKKIMKMMGGMFSEVKERDEVILCPEKK